MTLFWSFFKKIGLKIGNGHKFGKNGPKWKKQDHFIIWNFKSWRIKIGPIFSFRAILQSLRPFSISRPIFQKIAKKGSKWLKFEKIRPLLFLQLLKFHNIKWTYFFNLRPFWPFLGPFLILGNFYFMLIIVPLVPKSPLKYLL